MRIKMVVAHDINLGIGFENKLVWNIPEDLKHFKNETENKIIVMGSKTFYSIGKPLPNRVNAVLTSSRTLISDLKDDHILPKIQFSESIFTRHENRTFKSINDVLETYKDEDEIVVIGGDSIYNQFLDIADELVVTVVLNMFTVDTHFPFYLDKFEETERSETFKSKNGEEYFIARFKRIQKD